MKNSRKLFPRNLTAYAETEVKGNPVSSRLESGVDNCYPGLEFDQRNLDQSFFPGLKFEFHKGNGAKLVDIVYDSLPYQLGLSKEDIENNEIYLWAVIGKYGSSQTIGEDLLTCTGLNGLEVWRRIHDLNHSRVGIILGVGDGFSNLINGEQQTILTLSFNQDDHTIKRNEEGKFIFAAISGMREHFLNEFGVIDPNIFQPGELTKSLCSPWQYDFRDCGCFYWASNKPDIVTSSDKKEKYLNYIRKDRNSNPPTNPMEQWDREKELDYDDFVNGKWEDLPVVINDRETDSFKPNRPIVDDLMTRDEVISELQYLATVEHALCVEYLYAHYSIDAPMQLQQNESEPTKKKFAAAKQVLDIGIDEMRHFRWVNEALSILGESPIVDRATEIHRQLKNPFKLLPLTKDQLQWFIDVEKPSQDIGQSIDGMYVKLLTSVEQQPDLFPEAESLVHLFKLIIDEGEDHYQRFLSIQNYLSGMNENDYLRSFTSLSNNSHLKRLQEIADSTYQVMIGTLYECFLLGDLGGGLLLEQARRAMYNLHEQAHYLAKNRVDIRFEIISPEFLKTLKSDPLHGIKSLETTFNESVNKNLSFLNETEKEMVLRHKGIHEKIFVEFNKIISQIKE